MYFIMISSFYNNYRIIHALRGENPLSSGELRLSNHLKLNGLKNEKLIYFKHG